MNLPELDQNPPEERLHDIGLHLQYEIGGRVIGGYVDINGLPYGIGVERNGGYFSRVSSNGGGSIEERAILIGVPEGIERFAERDVIIKAVLVEKRWYSKS
jgi:hypothetical protein